MKSNWIEPNGRMVLAALIALGFQGTVFAVDPSYDTIKSQFASSAHAQAGLSCADCHGGDPKVTDATALAAADFRHFGSKKEIAEMCAHCHSDVRRMNPYGIPTDQFERYKTSKHGEQLLEHGDEKVAVCTDCHGVHDIAKVNSPQSHVYPSNVPDTCGKCHGDEKLMSQYKLPSDVVTQYKTSYHAYMLYQKGDLSAPTCATCHGSHGAVPPGIAQVPQVCGKCHVRQRELFEKSPHAELMEAGLFEGCISCHGNHGIQKASVDLFAQACVKCHATDKKQLAIRDEIAGMIRTARSSSEAAAAKVQQATVRGLATDDEQLLLEEARTQVTQLEAIQHLLAPDQLRPLAKQAQDDVQQTLDGVTRLERIEQWKVRALWPVWIFLAVMAVLFWARRRQLE